MNLPLHIALIRTQSSHMRKCRSKFQELDLSDGQPKILSFLLNNDGILQKELAQKCGVSAATITSLLQNMQAKELITKEEIHISGGKRGYQIFLTAYGRELAHQVCEIMNTIEEKCYIGFSEDEKKMLLQYLDRIVNNLEQ